MNTSDRRTAFQPSAPILAQSWFPGTKTAWSPLRRAPPRAAELGREPPLHLLPLRILRRRETAGVEVVSQEEDHAAPRCGLCLAGQLGDHPVAGSIGLPRVADQEERDPALRHGDRRRRSGDGVARAAAEQRRDEEGAG